MILDFKLKLSRKLNNQANLLLQINLIYQNLTHIQTNQLMMLTPSIPTSNNQHSMVPLLVSNSITTRISKYLSKVWKVLSLQVYISSNPTYNLDNGIKTTKVIIKVSSQYTVNRISLTIRRNTREQVVLIRYLLIKASNSPLSLHPKIRQQINRWQIQQYHLNRFQLKRNWILLMLVFSTTLWPMETSTGGRTTLQRSLAIINRLTNLSLIRSRTKSKRPQRRRVQITPRRYRGIWTMMT